MSIRDENKTNFVTQFQTRFLSIQHSWFMTRFQSGTCSLILARNRKKVVIISSPKFTEGPRPLETHSYHVHLLANHPKYGQHFFFFKQKLSDFTGNFVYIIWCSSSCAIKIHHNTQLATHPHPHDGHLTALHLPPWSMRLWKMESWMFPWINTHKSLEPRLGRCKPHLTMMFWTIMFFWFRGPFGIPLWFCGKPFVVVRKKCMFPIDLSNGTWHTLVPSLLFFQGMSDWYVENCLLWCWGPQQNTNTKQFVIHDSGESLQVGGLVKVSYIRSFAGLVISTWTYEPLKQNIRCKSETTH